MKKFIIAILTSMGALALGGIALATGAEQPKYEKPTIEKMVSNVTAGSELKAADTLETAIVAHTGDVLIYKVRVSGNAWGYKTEDVLPDGLELISKAVTNHGKNLDITVKVTANDVPIRNTACLVYQARTHTPSSGLESELEVYVLDKSKFQPRTKQDICNDAWVKVYPRPVATPLETPKTVVTNRVVAQDIPTVLPSVGAHGGMKP